MSRLHHDSRQGSISETDGMAACSGVTFNPEAER